MTSSCPISCCRHLSIAGFPPSRTSYFSIFFPYLSSAFSSISNRLPPPSYLCSPFCTFGRSWARLSAHRFSGVYYFPCTRVDKGSSYPANPMMAAISQTQMQQQEDNETTEKTTKQYSNQESEKKEPASRQ